MQQIFTDEKPSSYSFAQTTQNMTGPEFIAMITSAPEALALHDRMARDMWHRAIKGAEAASHMRGLMAKLNV